jgi:hypothetical protein
MTVVGDDLGFARDLYQDTAEDGASCAVYAEACVSVTRDTHMIQISLAFACRA